MNGQQTNVESIFAAALEIDAPARRAAFLDDACNGESPLRARVEALLQANRDAGRFLERPALGLAPTIVGGDRDTVEECGAQTPLAFLAPSDKPGCLGTLGQYETIEVVGRGGMGVVLRAYDTKLNRVVAIKVMAPELAVSATAAKRFLREARAAAAISHDHVVTIHAIDEANHPPFLVMEFIDGASLQEKIERLGALEVMQILRIGMQTAAGLAAAHKQGLVHRDVKPANILLENGIERVKITDFGLARAADDEGITQSGLIAGTPQFMSPEQAQGQPVDARGDLFSLGSVLFAMCTGRSPFRAETAVATLRRVCDDAPRPIREVNSEIPDWLEAIILKLLAKNPDERFQSAEEVADLLGGHLAHLQHPTTAPRPALVRPGKRQLVVDDELSFIATAQRVYAVIALAWAIIAIAFAAIVFSFPGDYKASLFAFPGDYSASLLELNAPGALITGVLSAITGSLAWLGRGSVKRRDSFRWALAGNVAALLPVNPPLIFAVPWSIAAIIKLRHPDVRRAFVNDAAVARLGTSGSLREPKPLAERADTFDKPSTRRVWPLVAAGLTAMFVGIALLGTVVYVKTDQGTLVIESDDENVEIQIARPRRDTDEGIEVRIVDRVTGSKVVRLRSGHYSLLLIQGANGNAEANLQSVQLSTEQFVLKRGDRVVVKVTHTPNFGPAQKGMVATGIDEVRGFPGHTRQIEGLQFFTDGRAISASYDMTLRLWDADGGHELDRIDTGHTLSAMALSPDQRLVAVGTHDGPIEIWNLETRKKTATLEGHTDRAVYLAFTPDGRRVMSSGFDPLARVWDLEKGTELRAIEISNADSASLSPDGRFIVARDPEEDGKVRLWDVDTGQLVKSFDTTETGKLLRTAFSPDGSRLATGSTIGVVQIWDVAGENELRRIDAHRGPTLALAFTPDGRRLVSSSIDGALRLWDAATGRKLAETLAETRRFNRLAISPDGRHVITGGGFAWDSARDRAILDGDNDLHLFRLPEISSAIGSLGEKRSDPDDANSLGMTMRLIPAGEFEMGTADDQSKQLAPHEDWFFANLVAARGKAETPRHRVTITRPFYLAAREVTVRQFRLFVEDAGYKTSAEQEGAGYGWRNAVWRKDAEFNWRNPGFPQTDDHPVCNVSWADAVAFCRWLSDKEEATYRLPTEAEWEYACRAGTTTIFSTGDDPDSLRDAANLADASLSRQEASVTWAAAWDDGYAATAPVGSFAPNAYGLHDMHGNACEWCEDEYNSDWYRHSPAADPVRRARAGSHVFRGGGWDNWAGFLRSADRYSSHSPTLRTQWAGFRVVRETAAAASREPGRPTRD